MESEEGLRLYEWVNGLSGTCVNLDSEYVELRIEDNLGGPNDPANFKPFSVLRMIHQQGKRSDDTL